MESKGPVFFFVAQMEPEMMNTFLNFLNISATSNDWWTSFLFLFLKLETDVTFAYWLVVLNARSVFCL